MIQLIFQSVLLFLKQRVVKIFQINFNIWRERKVAKIDYFFICFVKKLINSNAVKFLSENQNYISTYDIKSQINIIFVKV